MLALRPLAAADLPALEPWFNDAETRHWLGGRRWPANKLGLAGPSHHAMLGLDGGTPIGLVDIDIDAENHAAFAIVVAPERRRLGLGSKLVGAILAEPRFSGVREWFAGVETGNIASRRLLESCGFVRMTDEGTDGFSYFARRLNGWPRLPWKPSWLALPEIHRPGPPKVGWMGNSAF